MRRVMIVVVVCGLLAGCTPGEPEPEPSHVVPTSPPAGAEVACGVDVASIEAVSGYPVTRVVDDLTVQDGVGSGECQAWTDEQRSFLFVVDMRPVASEEARRPRDLVDGRWDAPSYTYDPAVADGAMWSGDDEPVDRVRGSVFTYIFWGKTLVTLTFSAVAPMRTPSEDFLAITRQVAESYGLPDPGSTP